MVVDTLGGLHRLRNTYIIFTSDNGFFYGEHRLTGGKFLAYEPSTHLPLPDPRAGDQSRHLDRRDGGQHRHRPDDPRTGRGQAGQERRRPLAGALHAGPRACAPGGRSSSSPSSRPTTSKPGERRTDRPSAAARAAAECLAARKGEAAARAREAGEARPPRSVAPPKDYEGIRLGPYKYIEWPDGEKELYDITRTPTSSTTSSASPTTSRSAPSSTPSWSERSRTASAAPAAKTRPNSR